ncbi:MAG: HPr family phosphocarrier protein [Anaerotruncus massiliensis (ex Togo et al. 2019)]
MCLLFFPDFRQYIRIRSKGGSFHADLYLQNKRRPRHPRAPRQAIVKCISSFPAATTISVNGKSADGKRLFALMGLGVKQNDEITVAVDGEREVEAAEAIKKFLAENL